MVVKIETSTFITPGKPKKTGKTEKQKTYKPINMTTCGGVSYNTNEFSARQLNDGTGRFELTSRKTGDKIVYYEQPETRTDTDEEGNSIQVPRNASVHLDIDEGTFYDTANIALYEIEGALIESSEKSIANVKLTNCTNNTVDLAKNNSRVWGDTATVQGGSGNDVVLDSKDSADFKFRHYDTGNSVKRHVEGRGTAEQGAYKGFLEDW